MKDFWEKLEDWLSIIKDLWEKVKNLPNILSIKVKSISINISNNPNSKKITETKHQNKY